MGRGHTLVSSSKAVLPMGLAWAFRVIPTLTAGQLPAHYPPGATHSSSPLPSTPLPDPGDSPSSSKSWKLHFGLEQQRSEPPTSPDGRGREGAKTRGCITQALNPSACFASGPLTHPLRKGPGKVPRKGDSKGFLLPAGQGRAICWHARVVILAVPMLLRPLGRVGGVVAHSAALGWAEALRGKDGKTLLCI